MHALLAFGRASGATFAAREIIAQPHKKAGSVAAFDGLQVPRVLGIVFRGVFGVPRSAAWFSRLSEPEALVHKLAGYPDLAGDVGY